MISLDCTTKNHEFHHWYLNLLNEICDDYASLTEFTKLGRPSVEWNKFMDDYLTNNCFNCRVQHKTQTGNVETKLIFDNEVDLVSFAIKWM